MGAVVRGGERVLSVLAWVGRGREEVFEVEGGEAKDGMHQIGVFRGYGGDDAECDFLGQGASDGGVGDGGEVVEGLHVGCAGLAGRGWLQETVYQGRRQGHGHCDCCR